MQNILDWCLNKIVFIVVLISWMIVRTVIGVVKYTGLVILGGLLLYFQVGIVATILLWVLSWFFSWLSGK